MLKLGENSLQFVISKKSFPQFIISKKGFPQFVISKKGFPQFIISKKGFPQFIHYTTSAINNVTSDFLVVDYLVNSLGFSKEDAIVTSSKISSLKSPENPNSVVNFLKTNGFNETQIRKVVSSHPQILCSDLEKTLKPKLKAFHDFGISGSELVDIVSVHPHFFHRTSDNHIIPALRVLKSIFGNDLILIEALKKSSWMLASNIRKNGPLCIALLKSYGFSADQIKTFFMNRSRYFVLKPEWLECILIRVEKKIGIPRGSAMFVHGVYAIGGMSENLLESKFGIFRSFGWSELDILTFVRKNPRTLMSSELKIRSVLNFFMRELGHGPAEIVSCTCAFTVSLEKRVIPRYEVLKVLKQKKLIKANYKIFSCLPQTDLYFFNKFVLPFKDDLLDVYTHYMARVGSSVTAVP